MMTIKIGLNPRQNDTSSSCWHYTSLEWTSPAGLDTFSLVLLN